MQLQTFLNITEIDKLAAELCKLLVADKLSL